MALHISPYPSPPQCLASGCQFNGVPGLPSSLMKLGGFSMVNRIPAGRVLTAIGQLAAGRPFRAARTGKNGSFSTPPARLPPEQHGSFHSLPNPANPPLNTLKVAHGMCVQQCVEDAARNQIRLRLPQPQEREGWCVWVRGVGVCLLLSTILLLSLPQDCQGIGSPHGYGWDTSVPLLSLVTAFN